MQHIVRAILALGARCTTFLWSTRGLESDGKHSCTRMEALTLRRGLCTSQCGFHQQEWAGLLTHSGSFPNWRADAIAIPRVVWSAKVQSRAQFVRCSASIVAEAGAKTSHPRSPIPLPAHPTYDLQHVIKLALAEDAGDQGDVTCLATISQEVEAEAQFLAKADGVIAGIAMANLVFQEVDQQLQVEWTAQDGDSIRKGQQFGVVRGSARSILLAERVVLNFMQRMSGIATNTRKMVDAAKPARILETRKTVPGLRLIDKWAVLIGGGENHRMGLFDMVMVKDNHIAVAGGISQAISAVEKYLEEHNLDIGVEVETRTLDEVREVLQCQDKRLGRVTRIMLDNMVVRLPDGDVDVSMLEEALQLINGRIETEASGNVTLSSVHKIGATGVTFISSGALTHSVEALDISLNVDTDLALSVGERSHPEIRAN